MVPGPSDRLRADDLDAAERVLCLGVEVSERAHVTTSSNRSTVHRNYAASSARRPSNRPHGSLPRCTGGLTVETSTRRGEPMQPDQLDVNVLDSEAWREILLLTSLMLACPPGSERLRDEHIDAVLGLPPRHNDNASR